MKSIRVLLAVMALLAVFVFPTSVSAATQGSCPANDTSKVLLFENSVGDSSDGDDRLWACGDVSNLGSIAHTPATGCHTTYNPPFGTEFWDHCVSSIIAYVPAGWELCFYKAPNYVTYQQRFAGFLGGSSRVNIQSDLAYSLRFVHSTFSTDC